MPVAAISESRASVSRAGDPGEARGREPFKRPAAPVSTRDPREARAASRVIKPEVRTTLGAAFAREVSSRGVSVAPGTRGFIPEIVVINTSDVVGKSAAMVNPGHLEARSVAEMVRVVLAEANGRQVGEIVIQDHGFPGGQSLGRDLLLPDTLTRYRDELIKLRSVLAPGAKIHLEGCNVAATAEGKKLLGRLSKMLGVTVYAGTASQRPLVPGVEGSKVSCTASGDEVICTVEKKPFHFLWQALDYLMATYYGVPPIEWE